MIQRLRIRFIAAAAVSLLIVSSLCMFMINTVNYQGIKQDADSVLQILHRLSGRLPEIAEEFDWESAGPRYRSPELPFEIRFFSVLLDATGKKISSETDQIISISEQNIMSYATSALQQQKDFGFVDDYRYMRKAEGDNTRLVFLDCGRMLTGHRQMMLNSLWITLSVIFGVILLLIFLSSRIARPIAQSYEKQKRFITDAGHELKTPITIIQTDAELLSMEVGGNEWLRDIQAQTSRLSSLTSDLIYLARMEENPQLPMIAFPLSDVVEETAASFETAAKAHGQTILPNVQPSIECVGNEKAIRQLVSVLMENAIRYAPAGSHIHLRLGTSARQIRLAVQNPAPNVTPENLENLFERFYRADTSRNSQDGGHGIGLSVAKAIVSAHGGKIGAALKDDELTITVLLPTPKH